MLVPKRLDRFETLVKIIAALRAPNGCPWDREQTHSSLREFLLEETYETLAALDEQNMDKLRSELGDLLLQIVLHAQIADEAGNFNMSDVIEGISAKMVRRHPHVFGTVEVKTADDVVHNWEKIKQEERGTGTSLLASIPGHMPALAYSREIQQRVAEAGFDWNDIDGVIDKLDEEVKEFKQSSNTEERTEEFGDLLFTLVNFARRQGIDSESALREANHKFSNRFMLMEELCHKRGLAFADLSFEEQNSLWEEAKKDIYNS